MKPVHRAGAALLAHAAVWWIYNKAFACPGCLTGRVARASVFDQDVATNLLLIGSPMLVLALITTLLHRTDREDTP